MTNFLDNSEIKEAISSVRNAISGDDENMDHMLEDGIAAVTSATEMAFDPTGLAATEFATEAVVLLLRASKMGVENPLLKEFIEGLAEVGELTATLISIAKDATGIGIVAAIGKELVMQTAEGLGADALDSFNEAIGDLPEDIQDGISNITEREINEAIEFVEDRADLKPSSLAQALGSRQSSSAEIGG